MAEYFTITYAYRFEDGSTIKFDLLLDKATLALTVERRPDLPEWTLLGYEKCRTCPLDVRSSPHCPVAANLSGSSISSANSCPTTK